MDPLQFTPDPTLTDAIRKGIGAHLEKANADSGGAHAISGEVVEIGDDETGQPRIVVHTTREAIKAYPTLLLFRRVTVAAELVGMLRTDSADCAGVAKPIDDSLHAAEDGADTVAWQVWHDEDGWSATSERNVAEYRAKGIKVRALYTHPSPRVEVDEAMVERGLNAVGPGGARVKAWLPMSDESARIIMGIALTAALKPEAGRG